MAQRPVDGLSLLQSDFMSMSIHRLVEAAGFVGGDGWPDGPGLVGRWSGGAVRTGGGVGLGLGGGRIVAGPVAGMIVAGGVVFGSSCQRANASFNGAIVLRVIGGREQRNHSRTMDQGQGSVGIKGRTVIAFQ